MYAKWEKRWEYTDSWDVGLEAATIQRVRNSSPVKWSCAENVPGLKHTAEAADSRRVRPTRVVGERSVVGRRRVARRAGRNGSEYVGMSSDKTGEKPVRRKPKVFWGRLIRPELVGT